MTQQVLMIDGAAQHDLHRYALRWALVDDETYVPELYRDGKRVTQAWRFVFDEDHPADPCGGSANTA